MTDLLRIAPEVSQALHDGGPVVALETTLVAHGFPPGVGVEVGLEAEVVDTTGAGDALAAGFLVGGIELGLETAARCVAALGAVPS